MSATWREAGLALALALTVGAAGLSGCERREAAPGGASAAAAEAFLKKNARDRDVRVLENGVQVRVLRSGPAGGISPDLNDLIKVHYEGTLVDGTVFDSSFAEGAPAVFQLSGLIPAWEQVIPQMKVGDEWILYIPPALGYGEFGQGPIPPNAVLVFRIQLLDVLQRPGGATAQG